MLQKQSITIPLGLGVNTKTDEKLVEQGTFNLICENASFEKVGAVKKRQAYKTLSTSYYNQSDAVGTLPGDYTDLEYPPTLAAALGKSLLLRNQIGEYLYLHDGNFILKDTLPLPEVRVKSISAFSCSTTIDHSDTDYDENENMVIMAARHGNIDGNLAGTANNAATLILYSLDTETKIITSTVPNSTASSSTFGFARCGYTRVGSDSFYYNIVVNSNFELVIKIFNKFGQENATSYNIPNIKSPGPVDVAGIAVCRSADNQTMFIIANTSTDNVGKFIAISGTVKTFETTFAATAPDMQSMTAKVDSGLVHLIYETGRRIIFNANGTVNTADAAVPGMNLASVAFDQDSILKVFGTTSGVNYGLWDNGTQSIQNQSTQLMSDKVTIGGIEMVVGTGFTGLSSEEATYFTLGVATGSSRSGQLISSRFAALNAIDTARYDYYRNIPARFAKISDTKCAIALPFKTSPNIYVLNLYFFEAVQDFRSNSRAILGKNLHLSGGFVAEFDGVNLLENGFHISPSPPTLNVSGGSSLSGTFSYILVAKYTDGNGQVTRSAPSAPRSTGAIASKDVVLTMGSRPYGNRYKDCLIEIYRTTNLGSIYYLVSEVKVDMYSGTTISLITDTAPDSSISSNAILYTSGNVLQNDPGPSAEAICQGGNRIFLAGLEDENEVAYSKKKLFGESVAFSDLFRIRFDSAQFNTSGGVVAVGYMADKLIGFKKNSIFYVTGDGPNETGQGSFSDPELVSSDTGCTDPRSVVLTPLGIMFKGVKGIYLLNGGLGVQYIGSGVEEFNNYQVTSACHLDEKNEVIFSIISPDTSEKYQLVYDYFTQQWSVYTGLRGIDADVLDGSHVVLDSALLAPQTQNGADFLDNATAYSSRIKTPWIKVSGIQDFGRIWTCTILGKYKSAHTLNVKVFYDYATDYFEEWNIAPEPTDSQYQYRIHLRKQKCESVQFEIQDTNQTGESMELTALTLEVGIKKGSYKLSAGRKY